MSAWFLYVLECRGGALYAGISPDVERRFASHAAGRGGAFTRGHPPVRILAAARYPDRSAATRAENELKRLPRAEKLRWAAANRWSPP